ncbi:MAG: hypothetical protein ACP5UA_07260 [Candidatus Hydrogenedens sp.]
MSFSLHLFFCCILHVVLQGMPDIPYEHYFNTPFPLREENLFSDQTFSPVYVKQEGNDTALFLGTEKGLFQISSLNNPNWINIPNEKIENGHIFDIETDSNGKIYLGAWNGLYVLENNKIERIEEIDNIPIAVIKIPEGKIIIGSPEGIWIKTENEQWTKIKSAFPRSIRDIAVDNDENIWVATESGLICINKKNELKHYKQKEDLFDAGNPEKELVSNNLLTVCVVKDNEIWTGGLGGITVLKNGRIIKKYMHTDFPGAIITKIVYDNISDKVWVGTNNGLVCLPDGNIKSKMVFRSKRWLLDDNIRDIFVNNNHIYISTVKGVSRLSIDKKTLADKANYFEKITEERHTREPGIVEHCKLRVPGDLSTWEPQDDDNDGGYTNMYLASLSLQYAVTKDEKVQQRAKHIFQAILFLEEVTGLPGFIARTVVPADWTQVNDPNEEITPQQKSLMRVLDPRYKPVETRWRKSHDGKWLWKGDTSSDEITAHFFGWAIYYDLCADDEDKQILKSLVSRVMDKIIADGFVLKDIDGTHTRWGVWSPELLKHDPHWSNERGVNALEILSYLKASYHITGNEKYQKEYEHLLIDEDYASLAKKAKNYGPSSRTHIDDELLAFSYPALFRYEKDEQVLKIYRDSIQHWYKGIENEHCPLFNFIYTWCTGNSSNMEMSVKTLREIPYDLINWTIDNRSREDIRLVREPILEVIQTSRLLPPGETAVIRWDKNRWEAIQGDGGRTERAPTFYLFPYWLGKYLGLIE